MFLLQIGRTSLNQRGRSSRVDRGGGFDRRRSLQEPKLRDHSAFSLQELLTNHTSLNSKPMYNILHGNQTLHRLIENFNLLTSFFLLSQSTNSLSLLRWTNQSEPYFHSFCPFRLVMRHSWELILLSL